MRHVTTIPRMQAGVLVLMAACCVAVLLYCCVLCCCIAVCRLQQALPAAHITIYADRFGSDVTTHGAAGVWMPYKLSETPEALTDRSVLVLHTRWPACCDTGFTMASLLKISTYNSISACYWGCGYRLLLRHKADLPTSTLGREASVSSTLALLNC